MAVIKGLSSDRSIDWYVDSLTIAGFPATAIVACLLRYAHRHHESGETPNVWGAWAMAITHLGLRELEQAGRRAFADDRVGDTVDEPYFGQILAEAVASTGDTGRFDTDDLGYIDNALETPSAILRAHPGR